jgi:hypothetical protein
MVTIRAIAAPASKIDQPLSSVARLTEGLVFLLEKKDASLSKSISVYYFVSDGIVLIVSD